MVPTASLRASSGRAAMTSQSCPSVRECHHLYMGVPTDRRTEEQRVSRAGRKMNATGIC